MSEQDDAEIEHIAGHKVKFKSDGYLHLAGYVDGEKVFEGMDMPNHVKEETRRHAKYMDDTE